MHWCPVDAKGVREDEVVECDDRGSGHADRGYELPLDAGKAQADGGEQRICLRVERSNTASISE